MSTDFDRGYNFVRVTNPHPRTGTDLVETAVYRYRADSGDWEFITSEPGDGRGIRAALTTVGVPMLSTDRIVHLRQGGEWMQMVPDHLMQPSTGRQRVEAEIADLNADARHLSEQAAHSGSDYDGGAALMRAKAHGMQRTLDLFDTDNNQG